MAHLSKPLLEINGRRGVELYVEYGTFASALRAYNLEFGTRHTQGGFQSALKRWMAKNPGEARELYNQDCEKWGNPVPNDAEWDTIIRRIAKGAFKQDKFAEWQKWYNPS